MSVCTYGRFEFEVHESRIRVEPIGSTGRCCFKAEQRMEMMGITGVGNDYRIVRYIEPVTVARPSTGGIAALSRRLALFLCALEVDADSPRAATGSHKAVVRVDQLDQRPYRRVQAAFGRFVCVFAFWRVQLSQNVIFLR